MKFYLPLLFDSEMDMFSERERERGYSESESSGGGC